MKRPALFAFVSLAALALFAIAPVRAEGLAKGSSLISIQLTTGTADLATPEGGSGSITAYDHSEWGGQLHFQRLLSDDWALALSGGIGTFKETDTPADPAGDEFVYTQSSWQIRVGADRFVHISPTFHLFVGPGIQYWSGKAEFEEGPISVESESATRFALNGRMGAHIALSNSIGLAGHLGHYWGFASAEDAGAEVSWSPSGIESAVGFSFKL